jgi:hypothetical protein
MIRMVKYWQTLEKTVGSIRICNKMRSQLLERKEGDMVKNVIRN